MAAPIARRFMPLLRYCAAVFCFRELAMRSRKNGIVITSYSIHYTKLYERMPLSTSSFSRVEKTIPLPYTMKDMTSCR